MTNQKNNSDESRNVEIIPVQPRGGEPTETGRAVQRGRQNIIIGTLNLMADPVRGAFVEPIERRYYRHYRSDRPHSKGHLVADVLMFLAIVGLVGLNLAVYIGFGRSFLPHVQLAIEHEGELVSGEEATYTLRLANENEGSLQDAKLALRIPRELVGVIVEPSDGFNRQNNTVTLRDVEVGSEILLKVRGMVIGEPGTGVTLGATVSYRPEESKRGEQKLAIAQQTIARSALTVEPGLLPARIVNGSTVSFEFRYANTSSLALPRTTLTPELPSGFTLIRAEPALTRGSLILDSIAPASTGVLHIEGRIDGKGQAAVLVPLSLSIRRDEEDVSQGTATIALPIFYPKMTAALTIDTPSLRSGELSVYSIAYENKESQDVLDAQIAVVFPKGFINASTFTSTQGKLTDDRVEFTKASFRELALLKPGSKGTVSFTVAPRETLEPRILFPDGRALLALPVVTSYRMEPDVDTRIEETRSVELKVGAGLQLQSFARYFTPEGDQLGRGPIPPLVDRTTRYWIFWNVVNQVSDVRAAVVSGVLPLGVEWTGKTSVTYGDALKYDPTTRTVLWNLDVVKRETGGIYPDVGGFFEVALTPTEAQVGAPALLVTEQKVTGQDTGTNEVIERDADDVTTELATDPLAKGKGKVKR